MKYNLIITIFFIWAINACSKNNKAFLIEKNNIGGLTPATTIQELSKVFASDSVVKESAEGNFTYASKNRYLIYDKQGNHLLTLTPTKVNDSIEVIENIRIIDNRYKTAKGISVLSTFKDINSQYNISRINNSLNNILIFTDEINAYFVIDKTELPESIRYTTTKIEEAQIPDTAKIKYFMVGWQ